MPGPGGLLVLHEKYGPVTLIWLVGAPLRGYPPPGVTPNSLDLHFPYCMGTVTLLISPTLGSTRFVAGDHSPVLVR